MINRLVKEFIFLGEWNILVYRENDYEHDFKIYKLFIKYSAVSLSLVWVNFKCEV